MTLPGDFEARLTRALGSRSHALDLLDLLDLLDAGLAPLRDLQAAPVAVTSHYQGLSAVAALPTSAALTDESGGEAGTTVGATADDNFATLAAQHNALRADLLAAKDLLNQVVGILRRVGLAD